MSRRLKLDDLRKLLGWPETRELRWHRHHGYPREAGMGWWLEDREWPRRAKSEGAVFLSDEALGVVTDDPQTALIAAMQQA